MKSARLMPSLLVLALATAAFAQSDAHKSDAKKSEAPKSAAQKSFDQLKTLGGSWEGSVTTTPPQPEMSNLLQVSMRVTSMGNAILHNMKMPGRPDDPITMLYLDQDRLLLTHYCDAGNRPRMVSKVSPDGKTVEFEFLDIAGSTQYGHMHRAAFTIIDANHHTEDWTFIMPGDKPVRAHFDLKRTSTIATK
jgi:hypothetical protein